MSHQVETLGAGGGLPPIPVPGSLPMHGMHWPMHTHTHRLLVCHTSALTTQTNVALYISYILLELEVFCGQQLGQEMTDSLASM